MTRTTNPLPLVSALPKGLEFDRLGRLVVAAPRKKYRLPVIQLTDGRLSTVSALVKSRAPHVVVAPHVTAAAKARIESSGWGWLETNGNAHIEMDGVLIHVEKPADEGARRPGALIVPPQGERVIRHLLDNYPRAQRFSEIARLTRLDKGYTSRILTRLRSTGLVTYRRNEPVEVPYPAELFELWQTIPTRVLESDWYFARPSSLQRLATQLIEHSGTGQLAFTGSYGANVLVPHLEPERIECYVSDSRVVRRIADALGGERASRGSNVTMLVHRDPGVLSIGLARRADLPVVSISQVYRDAMQRGRGREREAANELRRQLLKW